MSRVFVVNMNDDRLGRSARPSAVYEVERGEQDARGLGYLRRVDEYRADGRRIVEFAAIDGDAVSGGRAACLRQLLALVGAAATVLALPAFWCSGCSCRSISVAPDVGATIRRPGRPSWILVMVRRVIGAAYSAASSDSTVPSG